MSDHKDAEPKPPGVQEHKTHSAEKSIFHTIKQHPLLADAVFLIVLAALIGGYLYWQNLQGKIYIEKAQISAPVISLAPEKTGYIDKFYVKEGDTVSQSQKLAKVGDEIITARTPGIIIWIKNTPGQLAGPQQPVVEMIDPHEFRVIGRVQEDKGLSEIKPMQKVIFTVDAFGTKQYEGVVDSVATSARTSDIMFSISDKREEREFDVRVLFDTKAYPELKNGMSAKMWIYK